MKKSQQGKGDVNAKDNEGYTALMNESKEGNIKEVRNLLASGCGYKCQKRRWQNSVNFCIG